MPPGNERPALQQAETDGAGPVKRRRPALSCVECRKRKVKCDREKPCGECSKTKSPTCTYRSQPKGRHMRSPVAHGNSTAAYGYTQPAVPVNPGSSILDAHNGTGSSLSNSTDTVSELSDRLRHLEGQLAAINTSDTRSNSSATLSSKDPSTRQPSTYFVKSKFFGESHWLNCLEPYESLGRTNIFVDPATNRTEVDASSDLFTTVAECKRMARTIKGTRMPRPSIDEEVKGTMPGKDVGDQLVQCYLRTFEGAFRVLHIPTFFRDYESYWSNVEAAKPSVIIKMLLVFAIGVPFYTGPEQPRLRASSAKWIQAAEAWLSAPYQKSRLNMAGLQIHILLLLARQVCSVDGDLVWISAGSLLRSVMHLGLHRDPKHFQNISQFHVEMRRRLWATVMEVTVQMSLDMGMPPMISLDDYDTQPPSNFNDDDIGSLDGSSFSPRPISEISSMQRSLYETLPLRLEITRRLNSIRSPPSYKETLGLAKDLLSQCHGHSKFFHEAVNSGFETVPNPFQVKLFDVSIRRFALCLHRPFFNKAKDSPEYYYSRKICLDLSVMIATPVADLSQGEQDDWLRLSHHSVGFFKSIFLHSISTVYLELILQLEDQENSMTFYPARSSISAEPGTSHPVLSPQLEIYRNIIINAKKSARERIRSGETNAKGFTWLCAAVARIDALASNSDPEAAVLLAAKHAIVETEELMRAAYLAENNKPIDLSQRRDGISGREHGRGEGADDITGEPGVELGNSWDMGSADFDVAPENMDWENLMRDESLEMGWGFENSPESWFGMGVDFDMGF
ncbi:unnamed protein product [Periconia digitata]|uniref:Zn(2)-C6 fungal-type domain-containing protein n=1 Tax=Periconia digitata TaxID=1303443 RepID=A0A9W4UCJ6_9PLEO|nr:unnamed protein product [Periconia digitata]